ncbi:MAG: valine--tRNA ligase, partial [Alphaproteobacteria bacterium]|nr:valine--tRNA ligase [Alphaproteobacteria bacterium]
MDKLYNPQETEDSIYKYWMDNNCFTPSVKEGEKPFVIVLPPPNITGQLHIGHAFNAALQDIIIRRKRMQGIQALLLPGTDHAAIATETKVVEQIKSEGHTKETIGREGFLKKSWEWKEKYGNSIIQQFKKLGTSCDWTRLRFTMDDGCNRAVNESFVRYYNDGLIYRGKRMINWCPNCRSALSDAEVEHEEHNGNLYYIKYFTEGSSTGHIEIATTRPETMLGDTAVAVNPKDKRYKPLLGKNVILPLVNRPIPVIADEHIEIEFGTGVLKVTPAHSPDDYEIGLRHNLQIIDSFTETAHITDEFPQFAGQDRYTARKNIVKALKESGNLTKIQPHVHNVGTCQRCHTDVEPRLSEQWFVKMKPLAVPAIEAVKNGDLKIIPQRFEKVYFDWLENIRDWCISRQLWWGHRIPVWYCDDCDEMTVSAETPVACRHCKSAKIHQDEDVL